MHRIFGEMVLPLLIVVAAIWFTVTWKPNAPVTMVGRIFPVLVDLQVGLGIILWLFLAFQVGGPYLSFPFLLHPLLGLLAAGLAHMAVGPRSPLRGLGRWSPLASLGVLLVVVLSGILVAMSARGVA
ncbi:MAG: hypothetical protein MUD01_17370 [Chloroflexaceae bacterium]|nr:hypothetical protein [Chloroflexaceae bacterium]